MKKILSISALTLTALTTTVNANAEYLEAKQSASFLGGAIMGAAVGGPIGMFVGALSGAYVAEELESAEEGRIAQASLNEAEQEISSLKKEMAMNAALYQTELNSAAKEESIVLNEIEMHVFFHTNSDTLTDEATRVVDSLAQVMLENPHLTVNLAGHTDPRGNDDYNNVLSQYRAGAVEEALLSAGIEPARIRTTGYGSDKSTSPKGDRESYALERRVDIELINSDNMALTSSF
ncbi:OmpA family protein [Marinibactrum halimedae]|uniref:OmpA-like domain-containing protein n=1 Tax=Marinibactrum halimedae TaxID=1444977 RepID=A0AA37WQG2_9GAMM|nr:OmpA family protein [Marinibactrum halimedae]MCD9457607.1 OmpA family protein [Marinibactrum halimedae]GLS28026.1 hypothetical protein GCM10007877_37450 [Marinibactrum halimedae]